MNRYFTNKQGAIRRIIDLKRNGPEACGATVVGEHKDGREVHGLEQVLFNLRIGRIAHFTCSSTFVQEIVFVS
ncbi:hypothetical protein IAG25_38655 [Caballeronia sp. EK]|jgi:hypothetical protein|uniref:hypothetical protein n=1 Tax=Caballeronia TaxID=1827195 RepID=UPI0016567D4B|nr:MULTISPECIES: hypothetical protein [Caballeronia]MBC8642725.1 hypothetical protein [Caballeronia sp. EK]GJH12790.1 hypothetical protein CBA19CS11_28150 [Caballeronia novacaledonica]